MKLAIHLISPLALALALASCGDSNVRDAACGDNVCDPSESAASCAEDCGCGNGILDEGEACDGTDLGGATCASTSNGTGTLGCNADCTFDTDRCDNSNCGNGVVEEGEQCDGADLAGATCAAAGFAAGTVACSNTCHLDVGGCCNNFCDAANTSACAGDTIETCAQQANGCLALETTDCAAEGLTCDDSSGTATCGCESRCTTEGAGRCVATVAQTCTELPTGCLDWTTTFDCATSGRTCAIGPDGATCASPATGEDCFDPYTLTPGSNLVAWTASREDYMTATPTCGGSPTGPDIVLSYTATVDGIATYALTKEEGMRHVVSVQRAACGTITAQSEVSCVSEADGTATGDAFRVTAGTTYFFYVEDTSTGSAPLPNPLLVDISEVACSALSNTPTTLTPAHDSTVNTSSPIVSFELASPVKPDVGVITLTGDQGTVFTYNLATSPSAVKFANGGRSVNVDPGLFKANERVTVTLTGLVDEVCNLPVVSPTWTFALGTPSCSPGVGGMVGTTVTRRATGLSAAITEYYVSVDNVPNGYVYLGGFTDLYRMPKAGGSLENIVTSAVVGATQLGYAVVAVGAKVFTLDTLASTTSPFLWRLTTSGGVSWNPLGYAKYALTPGALAKSMFERDGRLYWVTDETSVTAATEVWSVSASSVQLPAVPVLEASLSSVHNCDAIAGDATYFYLACSDADTDLVVRVDRATDTVELITSALPLNTTKNELHADDLDADGRADVLYVKSDDKAVRYVCGPGSQGPFWYDVLLEWEANATGNYGLGFTPATKELWGFDDDTRELLIIR